MIEFAQEWKLKLYGGFELIAPCGSGVRLPYRSAQALVAVLALSGREGVSRAELGQILWPGCPLAKRQENLRQALAAAKAALGADHIEASRYHCRFADNVCVITDHEHPNLRGAGAFMPGFDGEWFERVGRRSSNPVASARLLDSFLHLLQWLADHDPEKMLGHMRDNHGLTFGLSYSDRANLLAKAVDDSSLPGWKKFFGAGVHGAYGEVLGTLAHRHKLVVSVAEASRDLPLAVQASSQVSLCLAWQNQMPEALSTVDWCLATAASCSDKDVWATATQMKGNILVHAGRIDEGMALLERSEQLYRDPLDGAIMRALRGFYLASVGRRDEAADLLDQLRPNLGAGHAFLNILWELGHVTACCKDIHPEESLMAIERIVTAARVYGDAATTMLALEELSKAYARTGETKAADHHMTEARDLRRSLSRAYTPWEKMRLAS